MSSSAAGRSVPFDAVVDDARISTRATTTATLSSRKALALAYLYLLRVPLLVAALLFWFPIVSLFNWPIEAKALFGNLFVLDVWETAHASLAAFILAFSIGLTSLVVLLNAEDRFGVRQPRFLTQDALKARSGLARLIYAAVVLVATAPMVLGQFLQADWPVRWLNVFGVLGGALAAYALAYGAVLAAILILPHPIPLAPQIFPAPRFMTRLLELAEERRKGARARRTVAAVATPITYRSVESSFSDRSSALPGEPGEACDRTWRRFRNLLLSLPREIRTGYVDDREQLDGIQNPGYGLPWSGVCLAAAFSFVTFGVYYAIGFYRQWHIPANESVSFPALSFVLLLLLNANWILSCLAFFLDRYRVPLLLPWVVLAVFSAHSPSADHYYRIAPAGLASTVHASQALGAKAQQASPAIVVTTAGGGIQASMWTVRVLTGLHSQASTSTRSFADSIALISSVSGGAAGSLFFASRYQVGAAPADSGFQVRPDSAEQVFRDAQAAWNDSLDDVAWALVYRDFPKLLFPYLPTRHGLLVPVHSSDGVFLDRGRMLELSWQRGRPSFGKLSDWRAGVAEGWRPAVIFNATIAETGEPFLFSTTSVEPTRQSAQQPSSQYDRRNFSRFYPDFDIDLVTAARLASGFPYVLPAPRARAVDDQGAETSRRDDDESDLAVNERYHLVDGGYYDNYGVTNAARWVDDALTSLRDAGRPFPPAVLILQIRSFPERPLRQPRYRGWPFQIYSPLTAVLNVKETGQLLRNREELIWLRDKWGNGPTGLPLIQFATFEFPETDAPLSFRMNPAQAATIEHRWSTPTPEIKNNVRIVQCVLASGAQSDCGNRVRFSIP